MFSPIDPADQPWGRRLVARGASGLLAHLTRMLWRHALARRCTFPRGQLAARIWQWNRRVSCLPRRNPTPQRIRFAGGVIMDLDLARLTDALAYCYGLGESEVGFIFRQAARPGDTILDVGGNIGTTALDFACAEPRAIVHVFEPAPQMLAALLRNLELNRLANVQVHPFGLGERHCRLWLQGDMPNNPGSNYVTADAREGICEVELRRLDSLPFVHGVSFIKIDVEGFELSVLLGGSRCIVESRPLIVLERNDHALARSGVAWSGVESTLQGWGYELVVLENGHLRPYQAGETAQRGLHNVIATNPTNPRHRELKSRL